MCKKSHTNGELDDKEFSATNLPNSRTSSIKIKQPNVELELPALAVK
jgi:hypothetical protein